MNYTPETYETYAELFKEAYSSLEKTSGVYQNLKEGLRFLRKPAAETAEHISASAAQRATQRAEAALAGAEAQGKAFSDEAIRRMQNMEQEIGSLRAARQTAQEQLASKAMTPRQKALLGATGVAALGVGAVPAYFAGQGAGEADARKMRNIAFGAGTVAGLSAPHLVKGLGRIAQGASATGLYPEMADYAQFYPQGQY